jgi:hypothetical protein
MRMLQRTLGAIVARADSEVVTVYHADNDVAELESAYPYPVRVQVLHNDSEAAGDARKVRTALAIGLRKLERSAKPLAALVLIGVALIMLLRTTTPTASGTNLGDVDKTLAKMKNVHIVTREWPAGVAQESWIARPSNILVRKTGDNCVLYDLARDLRRTLNLRTGVRTSERLSPNDPGREGARQFMASCLRDLVAEVSSDASLRPAEGERASGADKGLDVYEVRLPQTRNSPPPSRRLVYIDRATGRPQRMESYRPVPGADPEDATTIMIFEYPTGPEMDEILQTLFPAE